ncbi:thioredoxin family protein [Neoehrlichia mikurensis]|uniref:Thioredoxin family protein n=1 Tax=Neoehrlichia mikurensis TaxID=89586 RepID=A0A9Q9BT10_9RICK|nr:thioredoxin family protein [Neoehrlichia mikurensis]QXK91631.1 thioredoxin family protein [Neoehrlichia mikurensis]QXK92842.1 thioredoxin family protein [Neoehrlichia mikurensis]QXK93322.1 thioredoxin family protein [Neoehrlichia mikurensis]UTO55735.1 thioredoxin family protein [Neoehrlichia mikurensis]UTO56652.1 thioredoxin family protein [Neoehrlichia mikurensis]
MSAFGVLNVIICAFIGGVILNCMPCVFPILSLKIMSLIQGSADKNNYKVNSIMYAAGIMFSMFILSAALLILRHTGSLIGWGFQMQSSTFIIILMYITFLVGLFFAGFLNITFPSFVNYNFQSDMLGNFLSGILSTFIATPCTAPFMVSAVSFAIMHPGIYSIIIFQVIGLGIAFPYLLISFFPRLLFFLPKPGRWMQILKEFLSFPMYMSSIWLLYVLVKQKGIIFLFPALSGVVLIIAGIWFIKFINNKNLKFILSLCILLTIMFSFYYTNKIHHIVDFNGQNTIKNVEFSQEKLNDLLQHGKSIFLSIGAEWCLTCKLNEQILESRNIQELFLRKKIIYMKADWTNENDDIATYLDKMKQSSIPFYVLYINGIKVQILPQILSNKILKEALSNVK